MHNDNAINVKEFDRSQLTRNLSIEALYELLVVGRTRTRT